MNVTASPEAPVVLDEMDRLDRWAELTLARFLAVEAGLTAGRSLTTREIGDALGVADRHRRIIDRWARVLAGSGLSAFDPHAHRLHAVRVPEASEVGRAFEDTAAVRHCCGPALRDFYRACADQLPALLRDELTVQSLLFADPRTTDEIYAGNAASALVNALTADRVAELAPERGRVLEIGAGTGATTQPILERLPRSVHYDFTDVSEYFLAEARRRWADRGAFDASHYDLHEDCAKQGREPESIDVVVAANVLHNGVDAVATLDRVARLLRPGGHLVMVETGREHHPLLLSMYLLMSPAADRPDELPCDQRRHDGRILLRSNEWLDATRAAGLEPVSLEPSRDHPLDPMAQFVLVAHRPRTEAAR
ncbi:hypothetical protein BHE97_04880 [Aeromicrobium sp. PE09-221]|uniref:class I SAM-dependent methyltransferase n=1 Tax=Aeromicrobium sp. PE09-221 TaxID=1898043 RepID=UPI000B3EAB4F|nr:class I SAM-dependent methyltransferase [Aeromicrobium sp. PE09-221]OUZ11188.1 hypothetical protein BHE97_04880 [Aeromicrobium sp. PE09-221]